MAPQEEIHDYMGAEAHHPRLLLYEKIRNLKAQIKSKDDTLHEKNLALDALGYVWCSGGCQGGVLRYDDNTEITEEQVRMVEQNTKRLRTWFDAKQCRKAQKKGISWAGCDNCRNCGLSRVGLQDGIKD